MTLYPPESPPHRPAGPPPAPAGAARGRDPGRRLGGAPVPGRRQAWGARLDPPKLFPRPRPSSRGQSRVEMLGRIGGLDDRFVQVLADVVQRRRVPHHQVATAGMARRSPSSLSNGGTKPISAPEPNNPLPSALVTTTWRARTAFKSPGTPKAESPPQFRRVAEAVVLTAQDDMDSLQPRRVLR